MLKHLNDRKQLVVVGLNSGTSADGIDAAAVRIRRTGRRYSVTWLAGIKRRWPAKIQKTILELADHKQIDLDRLVLCDTLLGKQLGRVAGQLLRRLNTKGVKANLIASHGQTVRHLPRPTKCAGHQVRGTLQLGALEQIAVATSLVTVGDFRPADIAVGGEGAPITPAAMSVLFADQRRSRLIVNIGGMSNFFHLEKGTAPGNYRAADCGPGNCLMDLLAQEHFGQPFDRQGRLARQGQVSQRLLSLLLANPFFRGRQISTGREQFGSSLMAEIEKFARRHRLSKEDMLATATELTAAGVAMAIRPVMRRDKSLDKLYLTGGGRRNSFLVSRLKDYLPMLEVLSIDKLGFDGDLVEATSFAIMGAAAIWGVSLERSGFQSRRKHSPILGRIVQPPRKMV